MIKKIILITVLLAGLNSLAADAIPKELQNIGIDEKLGAQVDLSLTFKNEEGKVVALKDYVNGTKPVILTLAYYECPSLCNLFLNGVTDALKTFKWTPGREFDVITVSIDPREDNDLASRKKANHMKALARDKAEAGWHFLVNTKTSEDPNTPNNAKVLAEQVGFKYYYNEENSQYAHAAGMIFLTPQGKISRYLYGISFSERDLRLALSESSSGKIGTIVDRFILFCFNYDPKARKYSLYVMNIMRAGAALTTVLVGMYLFGFRRKILQQSKVERSNSKEV